MSGAEITGISHEATKSRAEAAAQLKQGLPEERSRALTLQSDHSCAAQRDRYGRQHCGAGGQPPRMSRRRPASLLLDLELTVDNTPTRLRLHQDQSLDAARQACTPTETPEAKDTRWRRDVDYREPAPAPGLTGQVTDADGFGLPGVSLVRDDLEKYDPVSWVGQSPLHVDIELPIQVTHRSDVKGASNRTTTACRRRTTRCKSSRGRRTSISRTARGRCRSGSGREMDLTLVEHRVALERTRKATPLDQRLHRAHDSSPVVSFDGFYPVYFVAYNGALFFDAQRVKVSGAFRPPIDGAGLHRGDVLGEGNADVNPPAEAAGEACFAGAIAAEGHGSHCGRG